MRKINSATASAVMRVVRKDNEHQSWYFIPLANETNKFTITQQMLKKITNFDSVQSVHIEFPIDKSK
jgi:hypothetical protein